MSEQQDIRTDDIPDDFLPFLEVVEAERQRQREKWGDDHDDDHSPAEWGLIALRYAGRLGEALEAAPWHSFADNGHNLAALMPTRRAAVRLAAVCYAVVEAIDRPVIAYGSRQDW
jgi:hypothetical protein